MGCKVSNLWFESTHHIGRGIDDFATKSQNGTTFALE
jgi:hypothetical protein